MSKIICFTFVFFLSSSAFIAGVKYSAQVKNYAQWFFDSNINKSLTTNKDEIFGSQSSNHDDADLLDDEY